MLRSVVVPVVLAVLVLTRPAAANRCNAGITDGPQCACPDFGALLADPNSQLRKNCPADWTPVIYDLTGTYAPDGTSSTMIVRASDLSPCAGLEKQVPLNGQMVVCWAPFNVDGCRVFKVPFNGVCFDVDAFTLGAPCTGECANLEMPILAIGTSGQGAGWRACPPTDPMTSCRSTSSPLGVSDKFRFQTGGFCATYGCGADGQPDADTCQLAWGASYFGFGRQGAPPGEYDWKSGGFKVVLDGNRSRCGAFRDCIGKRNNHWTLTVVGNPASGYQPPCLGPANACNPDACFP